MKTTELPSGILLVEEDRPSVQEPVPGLICSHCGKASKFAKTFPLSRKTEDSWETPWYTCQKKCGPTIACPDCSKLLLGCISCGSNEEYT